MSNSLCGARCGYIIGQAQVFNPVNYIFLQGSKAYPIDFIFMVILILYFFVATVIGIVFFGIRFLWSPQLSPCCPTDKAGSICIKSVATAHSPKVSSLAQFS